MRGRLVILLAVVAAGVAIAGEAGVLPPRVGGAPASTSAGSPASGGATRMTVPVVRGLPPMVCPGPETLLAPPGADSVPPGGPVNLRALVAPADGGGDGVESASLHALGAGAGVIGAPLAIHSRGGQAGIAQAAMAHSGGGLLAVPAAPDTPAPEVAAIQSTLATVGDLRGLISTGCTAAASDLWLVGGGSSTGRRGRLLLTNPSSTTPVTVDVTVLGPDGPVPAPAGQGVVVPAGLQVALLLDALAPGLPAAVVHVHARSGRIAGTLHDSLLRGLVPGGADDVPPATGPATRQVVAGLVIKDVIQGGSTSGSPDATTVPGSSEQARATTAAAGATAVRVAVPGRDEAIVRVRLLGRTGVVDLGAAGVATVPGGGVADIPVTGVPDGTYAALVTADAPVVAGAIVGRASPGSDRAGTALDPTGKAPPSEFGWAAASPPVQGTAVAALPPGPGTNAGSGGSSGGSSGGATGPEVTGTVTLASIGGGTAVIREISADGTVGAPTTVSVGAGASAAYPVGPTAVGLLLTGGPDLYAALVLSTTTGGPMISVLPLAPQPRPSGVTPFAVEDPALGLRS